MAQLRTAVNCEVEGHCLHEGTAVGSLYCCKCGQYVDTLSQRLSFYKEPYSEFVKRRIQQIDEHPEWGVKYL